jgi:hypothetical protein
MSPDALVCSGMLLLARMTRPKNHLVIDNYLLASMIDPLRPFPSQRNHYSWHG